MNNISNEQLESKDFDAENDLTPFFRLLLKVDKRVNKSFYSQSNISGDIKNLYGYKPSQKKD